MNWDRILFEKPVLLIRQTLLPPVAGHGNGPQNFGEAKCLKATRQEGGSVTVPRIVEDVEVIFVSSIARSKRFRNRESSSGVPEGFENTSSTPPSLRSTRDRAERLSIRRRMTSRSAGLISTLRPNPVFVGPNVPLSQFFGGELRTPEAELPPVHLPYRITGELNDFPNIGFSLGLATRLVMD